MRTPETIEGVFISTLTALCGTHHTLKRGQKINVRSNLLLFGQTIEYEHSDSEPLYEQQYTLGKQAKRDG